MNCFGAFLRIAFKNYFAYRATLFTSVLGILLWVAIQIAVWAYVFQKDAQMLAYMTAYVILAGVLNDFYNNRVTDLVAEKISSGNFAIDLIKPVNPLFSFWGTAFGGTAAALFCRSLPMVIVYSPCLMHLHWSIGKILLSMIAAILGLVLVNLIFTLIGYLAFVFIEIWPYRRLVDDTIRLLSGAVIPIAFFPDWLIFAAKLTPFYFLYTFPINLLTKDLPVSEITGNYIVMLIWIAGLSLLLRLVYYRAVKYCIIQGG
ncbi:MAG: ABC-2 family transporter protein [Bacillota bacterium]